MVTDAEKLIITETIATLKKFNEYVFTNLPKLKHVRYSIINTDTSDVVFYPEDIKISTVILAYVHISLLNYSIVLDDNHSIVGPDDDLGSSWSYEFSDPSLIQLLSGGILTIYNAFIEKSAKLGVYYG